MGIFQLVCLNPGVWRKCIESPATAGVRDYHERVRDWIFVFGRAHGLRKGNRGGLDPLDFEIWYFSVHFFEEKYIPASFELVKWNLIWLAHLEKILRTPMVERKAKTRNALERIDSLLGVTLEKLIICSLKSWSLKFGSSAVISKRLPVLNVYSFLSFFVVLLLCLQ